MQIHRVGLVAAALAVMAGCAGTRQARLTDMSTAAVDKASFVERIVLMDREQETLADLAATRTGDPIIRTFAQGVASDYRQHRDAMRRWESDRTKELAVLDLKTDVSGIGGSGTQQMSPEDLAKMNAEFHNDPLAPQIKDARAHIAEVAGKNGTDLDRAFLDRLQHNAYDEEKLSQDGEKRFVDDTVLAAALFQTEPMLRGHQATADRMKQYLGQQPASAP